MFKNLKQKTLNSTLDTSIISSRSPSTSSIAEEQNDDSNSAGIHNRYQSIESLSSISEALPSQAQSVFGNLEDIIDDLKNQINKKDAENKKQSRQLKETERNTKEVIDNLNKEVEGRQALERAYERLEDTTAVKMKESRSMLETEKIFAVRQLENQVERLKIENEKLGKRQSSANAVAWQNKAESLEKAYSELIEIQEHGEIQVQKMRDLLKLKDDEVQALENKFAETEAHYKNLQNQDNDNETSSSLTPDEIEALNWKVAKSQQEIESFEKQVVKLELELDDFQQKNSDKDFRITRLRDDIKNKDLVIDTQKSDALELANALNRTTNMFNDIKAELEACKSSYTNSLSDLQGEIDSITTQYGSSKQECRKQTELVEQLQIAASATKTLKTNLQKDLEMWKNKYDESEAACQRYVESENEHASTIEEFLSQLATLSNLNVAVHDLKQEVSSLKQNEEELKQENEYLTIARECLVEERNEADVERSQQKEVYDEKIRGLKEELELLRRSNQATILPVSSSLQAKFVKGVTEVDLTTRREADEDSQALRKKYVALERELVEKTKQLKQNQQHLSDLKRTLQDELRGGSSISPSTSRMSPVLIRKQEHLNVITKLPDNIRNGDSDDINLEYLKHCVIKYMCNVDSETSYLVRVISVLLNFTDEDDSIVRDALKYKASWFKHPPKSLKKLNSTRGPPGPQYSSTQ